MYLIMWLQERDILQGATMFLAFLFACDQIADQLGAPKDPSNTTEIIFEVPKGTTARSLGPLLQKSGIIEDGENFTYYVKITKIHRRSFLRYPKEQQLVVWVPFWKNQVLSKMLIISPIMSNSPRKGVVLKQENSLSMLQWMPNLF